MFTFVSVYNSIIQGLSSGEGQLLIDLPFRIFNVYPKLPWAFNIWDNQDNMILAVLNYLRTLKINIQKVGSRISLTVNMKNENKLHKNVDGNSKYINRSGYFMPCYEAPFKLFEGITREPFMSINNLSRDQPIYELHIIPEHSNSDGLEGGLILDPTPNERLRNHTHYQFDGLRRLNEQLRLVNINNDIDFVEDDEQIKSVEFDLSDMNELFPEIIVEKHEQPKTDDKLQQIRDAEQQRREITLRLAREQAERDAIEEEKMLIEEEALRKREEARKAADIEYQATNSTFEPEPYVDITSQLESAIVSKDYKKMQSLLGGINKQLELNEKQIEETNDKIISTQLISTDNSPAVQKMRPSYIKILTEDDKRRTLQSLDKQLKTLEKNKIKYQNLKAKLNKNINLRKNEVDRQNSRKGSKGFSKPDLKQRGETYEDVNSQLDKEMGDSYDKKYLKYKAKYLALKKQYNL